MATKDLLEQFLSKNNFLSAYQRIASKKASGGIDGVSVEAFGRRLDQNIQHLQEEIRERRYVPQPVKTIHIPKFNEANEWRELGLPAVGDKVVQAALLQVVEPLGERIFFDTSYGYRPGKGPQKALRRVEHNLIYGKRTWVVHRDIDNFFDTIDHDLLLAVFSELVGGEPILVELVGLWCKIGLVQKDGRWRNVLTGVRQGHIISPFLANLYLHALDKFLNQIGLAWVRYADNILAQCLTEEEAKAADLSMASFLLDELHLHLNQHSNPISNIDHGFTFLGVLFHGEKRSIDGQKIERMKRKIEWTLSLKNRAPLEKVMNDLCEMVEGWRRYYGFLDPTDEFSQLDEKSEKDFYKLAVERIRQGAWNSVLPEEMSLPRLRMGSNQEDGKGRLKAIWKQAVEFCKSTETKSLKDGIERKVGKRRRQHHREHSLKGDIVVNSPGHFIAKRGERIVIRKKQEIMAELPAIHFKGLTIGSKGVALSVDVIELCCGRGIPIHFMDELGRIYAVAGPPGGIDGETVLLQIGERNRERGLWLAKTLGVRLILPIEFGRNRDNCNL